MPITIGRGGDSGGGYTGNRDRGAQPRTGTAQDRPDGYYGGHNVGNNYGFYFPGNPFSPWGRWYPWYAGGYGYGYVSFDPWRYGSSRYTLWRYGAMYNPYDPFCGGGYYLCDPYPGGGGGGGGDDVDDDAEPGSLRLRVSPSSAKVYVDGTLVGTVDDFNGLSNHLEVLPGNHLIEIKADGYETFVPELTIEPGKTRTVRGSLKKIGKH